MIFRHPHRKEIPAVGTGRRTQLRRILKRIYFALGVLLFLLLIGSVGFYFIGDGEANLSDAFYMTLITITTVGYAEVVPVEGFAARLFTGLISLAGFGAVTFLFTSLAVFFLERDLDYTLRRRRMEKQIRKLRHHYIVCGFGRVGRNVAHELKITRRQFVAIDTDEECLESQREQFPDLLYLQGDGSDDDLLLAADIGDAAGVFAVTGDDSRNLMIALTAKQLNPQLRVVARCHELRNVQKIRKAGADVVVSPDFTGGMRIASTMLRPHVQSLLDEMLRSSEGYRLEELPVPEGFEPRSRGRLALDSAEVIVLGVRVGRDFIFNPPADFLIEPGQIIVTMCSPDGRLAADALVNQA